MLGWAIPERIRELEPKPGEPFDAARSLRLDALHVAREGILDALREEPHVNRPATARRRER